MASTACPIGPKKWLLLRKHQFELRCKVGDSIHDELALAFSTNRVDEFNISNNRQHNDEGQTNPRMDDRLTEGPRIGPFQLLQARSFSAPQSFHRLHYNNKYSLSFTKSQIDGEAQSRFLLNPSGVQHKQEENVLLRNISGLVVKLLIIFLLLEVVELWVRPRSDDGCENR